MNNEQILDNLKKIISEENIKQNELMKNHTSFKVGGTADFYIIINSVHEIKEILDFVKKNQIKFTLIGNGTNVIFLDDGIKGIVARINLKDILIEKESDKIIVDVDSGVQLGILAHTLLKENITGFEELSGIPGTIGGAIVMNAGAYGKEMKDIVLEVTAMDYNGNIFKFNKEQAGFSYRTSKFDNDKYIILKAKLQLEEGKNEEIKSKMKKYLNSRKEKQPMEYPNAGSTFKRGKDFITAQLIDEAGLKGFKIGGAQVSEKHAGFIVNDGDATAEDILNLVKYIKEVIFEKYKKEIELEIKVIK